MLATHAVSPLLVSPSNPTEVLENIKRCIAKHPQLALPNNPNKDIWNYYELLLTKLIVFDNHLVISLQVSLVDKSLIRSFVCNTKRPSVKQSMKWQVSSKLADLG